MTENETSILSTLRTEHFVGREDELRRIQENTRTLVLSAESGSGVTELLLRSYDRQFQARGRNIPFYFSFKNSGRTLGEVGKNFFHAMLLQVNAFRRNEPRMLRSGLTLREVVQRTSPADANIVRGLLKYFGKRRKSETDEDYFAKILSSPIRANAAGIPLTILLDDIHTLEEFDGGTELIGRIVRSLSAAEVPAVIGGSSFLVLPFSGSPSMKLQRLSLEDTSLIAKHFAADAGVVITGECADLIAAQFERDLTLISLFLSAAADAGCPLDSFEKVEQLYASEIISGRLARFFDETLGRSASDLNFIEHYYQSLKDRCEIVLSERERDWLTARGVIANGVSAKPIKTLALADRATVRYHSDILNESRAAIEGRSVVSYLKRAPKLLAREYRRRYSLGIRELLSSFSGETVPADLIMNARFADTYRGLPDDEILESAAASSNKFVLPNIVFAADTSEIYEPIDQVCDPERSAVGFGFSGKAITDSSDIVWIAAEIESKLEASLDHAEFWCDRLEMAALMSGLAPYKIWLIAPEGFSPEANELLAARGIIGSSKRQVSLLRSFRERPVEPDPHILEEVEITLPMDDRTELIAASIAEEIARRHNFEAKAINQIKTALIEAFINAAEHSLSPDRKVHNKFTVNERGLTIVISNRGVRLADKNGGQTESDEQRRGWGLDLMRRLMDEVSVEETDDGTRISMTKVLSHD